MKYIKRCILSLLRNKVRYAMLLLIIYILFTAITGISIINQTVTNTQSNILKEMLPIAMIGPDFVTVEHREIDLANSLQSKDISAFLQRPRLTATIIQEIGSLPFVQSYEYFSDTSLFFPDIKEYLPKVDGQYWIDPEVHAALQAGSNLLPQLDIRGISQPEFMDLEQNIIELVSGRNFNTDEMNGNVALALVSTDFAKTNQLEVGSVITARNVVFDPTTITWGSGWNHSDNALWMDTLDIEIIGLFTVSQHALEQFAATPEHLHLLARFGNRIYMPHAFVERTKQHAHDITTHFDVTAMMSGDEITDSTLIYSIFMASDLAAVQYETFFTLKSSVDLASFFHESQQLLPDYYTVEFSEHHFQSFIAALESLHALTDLSFLITIVVILVILSLLLIFFLRQRRYEIGVYLALGEAHHKLMLQILLEVLILTAIAIPLSLLSGYFLAQIASNQLLVYNILVEHNNRTNHYQGWNLLLRSGILEGREQVDLVNSYTMSFDIQDLFRLFIWGIATVIFATIIPLIRLSQMKVKDILMP